MQAFHAALAILLCALALCSQEHSMPHGADTPTACCFSYTSRPIKRKSVVSYFETSSQCSKLGIIFQTKRGWWICANPSEAWVQHLICDLEKSTSWFGDGGSPHDLGVPMNPCALGMPMRQGADHWKYRFPPMDDSAVICLGCAFTR
ncbi:C-C motif chemokine 3-like [Sorex fumeus]|uniref:C-C motif chemokine 3-like n=1 Tax=Sorex fumeus TaxID=62283 RepID=UPI0024ADDFD1|nr:C-C motif chemokine 3-like [Sorex fumeus]